MKSFLPCARIASLTICSYTCSALLNIRSDRIYSLFLFLEILVKAYCPYGKAFTLDGDCVFLPLKLLILILNYPF